MIKLAIWFTGLSGSGKSTLAHALKTMIQDRLTDQVVVLNGDNIRKHISHDLGFSKDERDANVKRTAHIARLFMDEGFIVLVSMISPYEGTRNQATFIIGINNVIQVHCNTPIDVCEAHDVKGAYAKARAGEIKCFTGVDDPYEIPSNPTIVCTAYEETIDASLNKIFGEILKRL